MLARGKNPHIDLATTKEDIQRHKKRTSNEDGRFTTNSTSQQHDEIQNTVVIGRKKCGAHHSTIRRKYKKQDFIEDDMNAKEFSLIKDG